MAYSDSKRKELQELNGLVNVFCEGIKKRLQEKFDAGYRLTWKEPTKREEMLARLVSNAVDSEDMIDVGAFAAFVWNIDGR